MAEDYSTVIGMALGNNSLPALFFHMDGVSGRVGVFWGVGFGLEAMSSSPNTDYESGTEEHGVSGFWC